MSIDEMKRLRRALARCALVIAREADTMRELSPTIDGKCYLDHEVDYACATLGCSRNELEELSKAYLDAKEQAEADWQRGYRLIGDPFDSLGDELP